MTQARLRVIKLATISMMLHDKQVSELKLKAMSTIFKDSDEIVIKPIGGFVNINIREIWQYRELLLAFMWRDIKVRYKQTAFGVAWAIIPPILSMIVFSFIFGTLIGIDSEGIPYPVFVFTGILIWNYFSSSLTKSSLSLVSHQGMIQKIYFPRLILPMSSVIAGLLDFSISFTILLALMVYYQFTPGLIGIILIPILLFITIFSALGFGLIFSAVYVRYRDVGHILPFFIQLGLFLTPVIYPLSILEDWGYILWFNPMTSVIENARVALLGTGAVNWNLLIFSLVISLLYFIIGIYYFRQVEKDFADVI
jgi:lipopolysaccharide transport system permease protein